MARKIEVAMNKYKSVTTDDYSILFTTGLGPCIGVALSYQGKGFMFHTHDALILSESITDPFFECVSQNVPASERRDIHPLVAGGRMDSDDPELDDQVNSSTKTAWDYVLNQLTVLGFGEPILRQCPTDHGQDIYLDIATNSVRIDTELESVNDTIHGSETVSIRKQPT